MKGWSTMKIVQIVPFTPQDPDVTANPNSFYFLDNFGRLWRWLDSECVDLYKPREGRWEPILRP